jgi:hypothetical protein
LNNVPVLGTVYKFNTQQIAGPRKLFLSIPYMRPGIIFSFFVVFDFYGIFRRLGLVVITHPYCVMGLTVLFFFFRFCILCLGDMIAASHGALALLTQG